MLVAVTGTRGKSSVARALGSVLRANGRRVLVKTTGTQAQFVLPDGSIEEVSRRGPPTILEQKSVLRKAAQCGAEVLVVEIMSIEPENHVIESQRILRPDVVAITNVRPDHTGAMGSTVEDIAQTIALVMVPGCRVFALQDQIHLFGAHQEIEWHAVPSTGPGASGGTIERAERFLDNERLVAAVARSLSASEEAIRKGLATTTRDRGSFTIWRYSRHGKTAFLANAFAANDPESTFLLFERSRALVGGDVKAYGIFTIRSDRGDRTLQWVEALMSGRWSTFEHIFLVGDGSRAVLRKVNRSSVLEGSDPASMTEHAIARMENGGILFGFGNTHDMGLKLVDHWMKEGTIYGT